MYVRMWYDGLKKKIRSIISMNHSYIVNKNKLIYFYDKKILINRFKIFDLKIMTFDTNCKHKNHNMLLFYKKI